MLEVRARCGAGRILAWTREGTTVETPLVLAHRATPGSGMPALHAFAAPDGPRLVQITGGFHTAPAPTDTATDAWSSVTVDRSRRITGHLGLRKARGANEDDEDQPSAPGAVVTGRAEPVLSADGDVALLAEAASLATDPARLMPALVGARTAAGPARILYAPGIGLPHQLALLTYAGVDAVDTLATVRATHLGRYLTTEGSHAAEQLGAPLCACATCHSTTPRDMDFDTLLAHNLTVLDNERRIVSGHIRAGTLRELVEARVRAHPATTAALRHLDAQGAAIAQNIPLTGNGAPHAHATTMESLHRPDFVRYRERVANDHRPPPGADVLLLLPCSARKPYATSKSHHVFRRVTSELHGASLIHEVIVTSPLGIVPRELENTWPAAHYDVPVTGHWDQEEGEMIRSALAALLAKGAYRHIVSHLPGRTHGLVADLLPPGTPHTAVPSATAYAARDALRAALIAATRGRSAPAWPKRRLADARAILTWQIGSDATEALFAHVADVSGRPPMLRLYKGPGQTGALATFVPEKGLFAFTLATARILYEAGCAKTVEIDDFVPRGTLFAVGVKDADPRIIPGDEVVLTHQGEVRGVGPAVCAGVEMRAFGRGACVEVRHHA